MAQINMRDVMAAYQPVVDSFDVNKGRQLLDDEREQNANINFDNRIQQAALPLTRMLDTDGELNIEGIKSAKPFANPYDLWNDIQSNMPKGRGIDPVVFQQKYDMGKQMFDMNIMNQIGQMQETGMDLDDTRDAFKKNKDLYEYALENSLLPREREYDFGGMGKTAAIAATGLAGTFGAEALARNALNRVPVKPSLELSKELAEKGFARKGTGGIKKLNDIQIRRQLGIVKDQDLRKTKKDGTVDKRLKKKLGYSKESEQILADYKKKVDARIKNSTPLRKALGGNRAATGKVLRNVPKFVSREPSFALKAAKLAKKIPRYGGLIAAGIGGGALASNAISKLFED